MNLILRWEWDKVWNQDTPGHAPQVDDSIRYVHLRKSTRGGDSLKDIAPHHALTSLIGISVRWACSNPRLSRSCFETPWPHRICASLTAHFVRKEYNYCHLVGTFSHGWLCKLHSIRFDKSPCYYFIRWRSKRKGL